MPASSRALTFLLTDVEGSTALWESQPRLMASAMARHDAVIGDIVAQFGGEIVKARGEGDSQFAVFNEPGHAVSAAAELQRSLSTEFSALPFALKVRMGQHTGEAEWRDGDYYGAEVNRGARVRSLGHGGQTLLSEATAVRVREELGEGLALVELGTHRLKGLSRPEKVFQLNIEGLPDTFPPLQTMPGFADNLPSPATPLIGRERELGDLVRLLSQERVRLVTVAGPGGTGKTRLALAVGAELRDQYAQGVCFVDLAALSRPDEIAPAIAAAIGYQAPDPSRPLREQLLVSLSQRQLLLVLDNFEHLLAGADLVADILQAAPSVTVLVTSRQRLGLASETRYDLRGLTVPERLEAGVAQDSNAVELFVASGRRAQPDFELTESNAAEVARICQLVQGMPLGLILAATWLGVLNPAEIAAEISASLEFLSADLADLPPRQRSMQAVFDGSWQRLDPAEQAVLTRLSIFRGGFTRDAAEMVAGANLRILLSLVDKSLLQRHPETNRFMIHELLRQYAQAQLSPAQTARAELAHARYFAQLVHSELVRQLSVTYLTYLPGSLAGDGDNLRRAWANSLALGLKHEMVQLAGGMATLGFAQGTPPHALLFEAVQTMLDNGVPAADEELLHIQLLGLETLRAVDSREAERLTLEWLPLIEAQEDCRPRILAYAVLREIHDQAGDPAAQHWADRAYQAALESGDERLLHGAEVFGLWIRIGRGQTDQATTKRVASLLAQLEAEFPDSIEVYGLLQLSGRLSLVRRDYATALDYGRRALDLAKRWLNLYPISSATDFVSEVYLEMGRSDLAAAQQIETLEWHLAIGQVWQTLGFLWSKAVQMSTLIDAETSVKLLSLVYHHPEVVPTHRTAVEENRARFEAVLGQQAFALAWDAGRRMDFDDGVALLRQALVANSVAPAA